MSITTILKDSDNQRNILIISGDTHFKLELKKTLETNGYKIFETSSQAEALSLLDKISITLMFLDIERTPSIELDIVSYVRARYGAEVVIFTSVREIEEATYALRNGAAFYLVKPVKSADLLTIIEKVYDKIVQKKENIELEQRFLTDLMAGSEVMQKLLKYAIRIAPTNSNVLIGGESGTGKEFFAKIIHRMSNRHQGRFVAMNCGAIPETLFESELFGYKKGAFTGADRDKSGIVEEAHLGTLFLDEVGELSLSAQVKLLRFLQEREFRRVGETITRIVDVRVIAATNKHLPTLIQKGQFREDLYFRLNVFYIHLPPLRERRETIPNLIKLFVHRNNQLFNKNINSLSRGAEVILANYHYPGNIRELENIIEHAVVMAEGNEITEKDLPEFVLQSRLLLPPSSNIIREQQQLPPTPVLESLADVEREHIITILRTTNYNYTEASKRLGISRSTLWRKIKEYKIETK